MVNGITYNIKLQENSANFIIYFYILYEYDEKNEKKYQYSEYFDHEPSILRYSLEIFEDFTMRCFNTPVQPFHPVL